MKKNQYFLLFTMLLGFFASCSTDVNLYADYKDIPVVYGLLDVTQDTNYVRINRAFSGSNDNPINANEVALIADSCNYPGKLNARICRYGKIASSFAEYTLEDSRVLDTMTIHNKQEGTFYSPDQLVYFVVSDQSNQNRAFFKTNTAAKTYKYRLEIFMDNDTVSSETGLVGGENFAILNNLVVFSSEPSDKSRKMSFKAADNAEMYDVKMEFNYQEKHGSQLTDQKVSWSYGSKGVDEYNYEDGYYYINYLENTLFNLLSAKIGADTVNVERYFGDFVISVAAGGEELYNYIQINSTGGNLSQTIPDYTNVNGGYGVFSSRVNLRKVVNLSALTQTDLYNQPWGFKQQ